MNLRVSAAVALAAALVGAAAGCSSSSSSPVSSASSPDSPSSSATSSSTSSSARLAQAPALIVQCALTKGLLKPPTGLLTPSGEKPWLQGKKVVITSTNGAAFSSWYGANNAITIAGQPIDQWVESTASSGQLPSAVCGSISLSALREQVYAQDPSAGDPWG
jgi:hypothetical protein